VAIGIVLLLFIMLWAGIDAFYTGGYTNYDYPASACHTPTFNVFVPFFFVLVVLSLLPEKMRLTKQEYAVIFIMCVAGGLGVAWAVEGGIGVTSWFMADAGGGKDYQKYFSSLIYGSTGAYFFWPLMGIFWSLTSIFFALLWRRQFVEVEHLSFPFTTISLTLIEQATTKGSEKASLLKKRSLFLALLLGLLYGLPYTLQAALGVSTFRVPSNYLTYNITPYVSSAIPMVAIVLNYNLRDLLFLLLLPQDVLLGYGLFGLAFRVIFPPIGVALGIVKDVSKTGLWGIIQGMYYDDHYRNFASDGTLLAMIVIPVVFLSKSFIQNIKDAIRGAQKRIEEPLSYRTILIGFVICFLIWVALAVAGGGLVIPIMAVFLFIVFMNLGLGRAHAEGISTTGNAWYHDFLPPQVNLIFFNGAMQNSGAATTVLITGGYMNETAPFLAGYVPYALDAMKISDGTETKPRDMLIILIVSIVIAMFGAQALHYGIMKSVGGIFEGWEQYGFIKERIDVQTVTGARLPDYGKLIAGFAVYAVVFLLRYRFAWWPINPVGFALAGTSAATALCCPETGWIMGLFAFILKWTIFKIGGTKLYNKTIPIIIGFLIGYALTGSTGWFITAINLPKIYGSPGSFPIP